MNYVIKGADSDFNRDIEIEVIDGDITISATNDLEDDFICIKPGRIPDIIDAIRKAYADWLNTQQR